MQFDHYKTAPDDSGRRLDRIVRRFLPGLPLSSIYRLIRKGLVRIDGKRSAPDSAVAEGAVIWVARLPELEGAKETPVAAPDGTGSEGADPSIKPDILFESADVLVLDKPVGIAVHGKGGLDTLIPQSRAARESLSFRSGPLHRLDRGTSGIIVFSKTLQGAHWFTRRIAAHECGKHYLGILSGRLEGSVEWYDESTDGKPMITFAEPLAFAKSGPARTLARFRIVTGRKHQIRFQCARHHVPLEGDTRYNAAASPAEGGYFLHAWKLAFGPGERLEGLPESITAPLPERFSARVSSLFGKDALARLEE